MKDTIILGISCYYHDSAACIIKNNEIIAAASEERFSRIKGDSSFPHNAINFCLNELNININKVDYIVYYENYLNKFSRLLMTAHLNAPKGIINFLYSFPKWLTSKLWMESNIRSELGISKKSNLIFLDHHLSHASSAFYPSPYDKAAILTIDGVGEWSTTTYGIGNNNKITLLKEIRYPDSIGLLYSAFTYYTGLKLTVASINLWDLLHMENPYMPI